MPDHTPIDPVLQEAICHYLYADSAPAIAEAMNEQAAAVRSARVATRKLIESVEAVGGSVLSPSWLDQRQSALLVGHQQAWMAACAVSLPGVRDAQIKGGISDLWITVFLDIIIDRMTPFCTEIQFQNVTLMRFFGTISRVVRRDKILLSDRRSTLLAGISRKATHAVDSQQHLPVELPFDRFVPICDANMQIVAAAADGRPLLTSHEPRTLYSYGPICDSDYEVRLESVREFAAVLDFVENSMRSAADLFSNRIKSQDHTWEYLITHKIYPTAFVRALAPHRMVESQAIQMGLHRYRNRVACAAVGPSREPQPDKPTRARAAVGSKMRPRQQRAPRTRREVDTP